MSRLKSICNIALIAAFFNVAVAGICISATAQTSTLKPHKYAIIGYAVGYHGLIDTNLISANKLTIINYAFVDVQNNRAWLTNLKTDTVNFKYLLTLKKKNPALNVVISIGGWIWSKNFSDAVLSDTSRQAFAASAVSIIRKYKLDGIDIDWEYPGMVGAGNIHRDVDKQNYTLMFELLRKGLDSIEHETGKKMLLTAAVGTSKGFLQHTDMGNAAKYLDYVNLMTYDYWHDIIAMHHTNLYASKKYNSNEWAAKAVTDFEAAGVPANKLVMGIAFYGRSAIVDDNNEHGLGTKIPVAPHLQLSGGYTYIKDSLANKKGFKYYKDHHAKAPYLYNAKTKQFISYDNEWSVKNKCKYVRNKGMGGVMFWEYSGDQKEYLLNEIDKDL